MSIEKTQTPFGNLTYNTDIFQFGDLGFIRDLSGPAEDLN